MSTGVTSVPGTRSSEPPCHQQLYLKRVFSLHSWEYEWVTGQPGPGRLRVCVLLKERIGKLVTETPCSPPPTLGTSRSPWGVVGWEPSRSLWVSVLCIFLKRLFSQGLTSKRVSAGATGHGHPAPARPQGWPLPCCCPAAPPAPRPSAVQDTDLPDSTSQPTPGRGLTEPFQKGFLSSSVILYEPDHIAASAVHHQVPSDTGS